MSADLSPTEGEPTEEEVPVTMGGLTVTMVSVCLPPAPVPELSAEEAAAADDAAEAAAAAAAAEGGGAEPAGEAPAPAPAPVTKVWGCISVLQPAAAGGEGEEGAERAPAAEFWWGGEGEGQEDQSGKRLTPRVVLPADAVAGGAAGAVDQSVSSKALSLDERSLSRLSECSLRVEVWTAAAAAAGAEGGAAEEAGAGELLGSVEVALLGVLLDAELSGSFELAAPAAAPVAEAEEAAAGAPATPASVSLSVTLSEPLADVLLGAKRVSLSGFALSCLPAAWLPAVGEGADPADVAASPEGGRFGYALCVTLPDAAAEARNAAIAQKAAGKAAAAEKAAAAAEAAAAAAAAGAAAEEGAEAAAEEAAAPAEDEAAAAAAPAAEEEPEEPTPPRTVSVGGGALKYVLGEGGAGGWRVEWADGAAAAGLLLRPSAALWREQLASGPATVSVSRTKNADAAAAGGGKGKGGDAAAADEADASCDVACDLATLGDARPGGATGPIAVGGAAPNGAALSFGAAFSSPLLVRPPLPPKAVLSPSSLVPARPPPAAAHRPATEGLQEEVVQITASLAEDMAGLFDGQELGGAGASAEERRRALLFSLNSSGRYAELKARLKAHVVRVTRERFGANPRPDAASAAAAQAAQAAFLSELYVSVMANVSAGLNEAFEAATGLGEEATGHHAGAGGAAEAAASAAAARKLALWATEAEATGAHEKAARYLADRVIAAEARVKADGAGGADEAEEAAALATLADAWLDCAERYLRRGSGARAASPEHSKAAAALERVVSLAPAHAAALRALAALRCEQGQAEEAEVFIKGAIGAEAAARAQADGAAVGSAPSHALLALHFHLGSADPTSALRDAELAAACRALEVDDAGAAAALKPGGRAAAAAELKARCLEGLCGYAIERCLPRLAADAAAMLRDLCGWPAGGPSKRARLASKLLAGRLAALGGDHDGAAAALEDATAIDGASAEAWCRLGAQRWDVADTAGAAEAYSHALDLEEASNGAAGAALTTYVRLGELYTRQAEHGAAREVYLRGCRAAASSEPSTAVATLWLGVGRSCIRLGLLGPAEQVRRCCCCCCCCCWCCCCCCCCCRRRRRFCCRRRRCCVPLCPRALVPSCRRRRPDLNSPVPKPPLSFGSLLLLRACRCCRRSPRPTF